MGVNTSRTLSEKRKKTYVVQVLLGTSRVGRTE